MVRADRGEYDLLNLPPHSIYSAWHYQCHITFMLAKKKTLILANIWICMQCECVQSGFTPWSVDPTIVMGTFHV